MSEHIIPDLYLDEVRRMLTLLAQSPPGFFSRPIPLSPEEKRRLKIVSEWREKREEEAYTLAPWLRAEVERDDW